MKRALEDGRRLALYVSLLAILLLLFLDETPARDNDQTRTMTAVYVDVESIQLDGELNEPEWDLSEVARNFTQNEPFAGQPATEPTEVRVLYDRANLYIGVVCFDSEVATGIITKALERDFSSLDSDIFQVILDTFKDNRNGYVFGVNPGGAKRDMQTGGDGLSFNSEWDAVWDVKVKVTDYGWQAEFAIPFRSLRFEHRENHVWGINFERRLRRKNERTYWSPIPRPYRLYRVSLAGSLGGVSQVRHGRNLYFKPFISAPLLRREEDDLDFQPDVGFDVKYGITSGMTLDLTVNTDFSQVEADDAQINFTRFSLFFPEKREFFLENQEVFEFGNVGFRGFRRRRTGFITPTNDLIPFFSRQIGISDGGLVPILGGARLTGRAGRYRVGIISMQTSEFDETPSTNFSVARVRRDVLQNSEIGAIVVNKHESGGYFNRTYGLDASFRFFDYLDLSSYVLNTDTPGIETQDMAGFFRAAWRDPLWDLQVAHISIQDNFNAEVGFVPRLGIKKSSAQLGLTPRPEGRIPWVREFQPTLDINYYTNQQNELETREVNGRFSIEFNDRSRLSFSRRSTFERLAEEDEVLDEVLPAGDYQFDEFSTSYSSDSSRMFSGFVQFRDGEFYHGSRTSFGVGAGFAPNAQLGIEVSWDHSDISFPTRDLATELVSTRLSYSFNTKMFLSALIQYNSRDGFIASNIRFRLIHRPLSDFYLVYNEQRIPEGDVLDRALIAKLTYLFNF